MDTFYVIDEDGNVSWFADEENDKDSGPESFVSEQEAIHRAVAALQQSEAGE